MKRNNINKILTVCIYLFFLALIAVVIIVDVEFHDFRFYTKKKKNISSHIEWFVLYQINKNERIAITISVIYDDTYRYVWRKDSNVQCVLSIYLDISNSSIIFHFCPLLCLHIVFLLHCVQIKNVRYFAFRICSMV